MYKKLIRYDEWHFSEVDPVCLERMAIRLRDQINQKIDPAKDIYKFYSNTMPLLEAAIRGEITNSLNEHECKFISGNYYYDKNEGLLPPQYDQDFITASAEFSVTAEALSLEDFDEVIIDGVTYGWVDFEEIGDWPDKIKHP